MKKRIVAFMLALTLCASLCACEKEKTASEKNGIDLSAYPIKSDVTLEYWMGLSSNVVTSVSNFGETEYAKELQKRTGVKIDYIHPAQGQEQTAFNLLAASGDMPDIVEYNWLTSFTGGPQGAINNELILPLNDLVKEYAPNLMGYLKENPDIDKSVKTDDGTYYVFPFVRARNGKTVQASYGPIIRKDWLDELGIKEPETTEDWEKMLIAFRDKKGVDAPLTVSIGVASMRGLFKTVGAGFDFYVENDTVKCGVLDTEFKTAIETLARWYKEGLLDRNYALVDLKTQDSKMLSGQAGATFGSAGSSLGKWLGAKSGEAYELCGVKYPDVNGKPNKYNVLGTGYSGEASAAISAKSENPELAAKFLDYVYGDEGHTLVNFGVEGVSFEKVDGEPKYTDLIMNNPDGLPAAQTMAMHFRASTSGAFVQDKRYLDQYYQLEQQQKASAQWSIVSTVASELPPLTTTTAESNEYATLYNDIQKFRDENIAAFIAGNKPLSELDAFVEKVKEMGIERVLEIQQTAYDRYLKR